MKKIFTLLCLTILFSFTNRETTRLETIVKINSGSANVNGVKQVLETVKPWFEELHFKVSFIANPISDSTSAPLFVAERAGEKSEFITFIMHADTVFEPSSPFQNLKVTGDVINGPGVMDDKGGIVMMARALEMLLSEKPSYKYSLRIIISPNEEVGSPGFGKIFQEFSQKSWLILGLEPAYDDGGIVEGRKGNIWYHIKVQGKEAHAGRDHKSGINACFILAQKIIQLQKLTDYKKNLTISIGHIEGGQDKFNIVCGSAEAKIDVRVPSLKIRQETMMRINHLLKHPQVSYTLVDETPPFGPNQASRKMLKNYLQLIQSIDGTEQKSHFSGGVGDTNQFSREGIVIMDGLGPVGGGAHTEQEFLKLSSIETRAKILSIFLKSL